MTDGRPDAAPPLKLDEFAARQFNSSTYAGTRVEYDPAEFERKVNDYYAERHALEREFSDRPALVDGYAPFCKHLFVPNFTGAKASAVPITPENEHLLRSRYEARRADELPVLVRYLPAEALGGDGVLPEAKYLDVILYSREQCAKEAGAMGRAPPAEGSPWRIISIKAQDEPYETPMQPITVMRNALIGEGGSGVPLDRQSYLAAVEYWSRHAPVL